MNMINTTGTFALLGAWAFAPPLAIQSNEDGKWSIEVGGSAGQYEVVTRSCSGAVLSTRPVEFVTGGAVVEYEASNVRLDLFGGSTSVSSEFDLDGLFLGGLAAYEGTGFGLGGGRVSLPSGSAPSIYLRLGNRDGVHFRTDYLAPSPTPGVTGLARAGIGFPIGSTQALVGFSAGRGLDLDDASDWGGLFGEFGVPLGGTVEARLAGSVFFPEEHADWAAGIGLRIRLR
jgi:hypothetical protein